MTDPGGIPRTEPGGRGPSATEWTVEQVVSTGSTNADLLAAAEAGTAADRTVLRADHQTAGRGRLDRSWDAPAGANLLASILFTHPPNVPSRLTQAVGRASLDAVEALVGNELGGRLGLKWPNDLLLDDRKLSGVLAQRSAATGAIVVGIGLNVGWAPDGAASLAADLGTDPGPAAVLARMLIELDRLLGDPEIVTRYRERLATLGSRVRAELPDGRTITGVAVDLDADGRLCVDDDNMVTSLDVGDIVHLRPA